MRVYDQDEKKEILRSLILLSISEALELIDDLKEQVARPSESHSHLMEMDGSSEATITVYDPENLEPYDAVTKNLLENRG
jgi:hypothetical protein